MRFPRRNPLRTERATFTALGSSLDKAPDGGYATPLISKGIVRCAAKGGQVVDLLSVPFEIPDHVWAVLEEHRKDFPYLPPRDKHPPWAQ